MKTILETEEEVVDFLKDKFGAAVEVSPDAFKAKLSKTEPKGEFLLLPDTTTTTTKEKNGKRHKKWSAAADAILKRYAQMPRLKRDELVLLRRRLHNVEGFIRSKHAISVRLSWMKTSKVAAVKLSKNGKKLVRWTDSENAKLKANLSLPNSKIGKIFPHRTFEAVRLKANKVRKALGIKSGRGGWTTEEDKIILANSAMKMRELAKMFPNRSYTAVSMRKRKLKVSKQKASMKKGVRHIRWTEAEKKLLAENSGEKMKELVKLFPNRNYNAVQFKLWQMRHKQPKAAVEKLRSFTFDCVEDKYQTVVKNAFERLAKTGESIKLAEAYFFGLDDDRGWDDFLKEVLFKTALIKDAYGVKVTVKNGKVVSV